VWEMNFFFKRRGERGEKGGEGGRIGGEGGREEGRGRRGGNETKS